MNPLLYTKKLLQLTIEYPESIELSLETFFLLNQASLRKGPLEQ